MRAGKRSLVWVGTGQQCVSYVNVVDFATACVLGITRRPGNVILNICDDTPVRVKYAMKYLADLMNAPPPRSVPKWL